MEAPGLSPQTRNRWLGLLLLFSLLIYANCLFNGFVFDDHSQIERNPFVHSFRYVGKLFGTSLLAQQGKQAVPNFYRPLTNFTFLVCYKLFGESPLGYHLISILLHCTAVGMVFLLGANLFRDDRLGLLAAFLFAIHPVHVEPVAWVDGIGDPLVTIFVLLALWFYLRLAEDGGHPRYALFAGMVAAFAAALFTKETAVVFTILAVVFEHCYREDRNALPFARKFSRYAPLWLTLVVYIAMRVAAVGQLIPSQLHSEVTRTEAVYNALALVWQYARKLIWPAPLVAFYPFQKSTSFFEPPVLLGVGVLLAALALFVFLWKRAHLYSFTLLCMAMAIAPALNTRWMTASVFAERYLYLPSVAFSWLVAGALLWLWSRAEERSQKAGWAVAGALAMVGCFASYAIVARTFDWRNDRSLVVSILRVLPDSPHAHVQYGIFRWNEGARADAEAEWKVALSLNPESVEAMAEMGRAMLEEKDYLQALAWLQQAIALKPNFATAHVLLGQTYEAQGQDSGAESEFQRALSIHPNHADAMNALGKLYLKNNRLDEAAEQFRASAQIAGSQDTWASLGKIYEALGKPDQAMDAWRQVIELERFNPEAHRALGGIYLSRRQWKEAEHEFQMCLLMDPKDTVALAGLQKIKSSGAPYTNSSASQ
jgi:tetratricopeptide (TPR) repeat protein